MWTEEQRKRHKPKRNGYESDLSDPQWELIKPLLPEESLMGRPGRDQRVLLNAIAYFVRTGVQWRMLPKEFGPWQTVYGYTRKLQRLGTWEQLHTHLLTQLRQTQGKNPLPTAAIVDSQSVKTSEKGGVLATMQARKSRAANAICS